MYLYMLNLQTIRYLMNFNNTNSIHYSKLAPTIWLTGLPGSGKTTLGQSLLEELRLRGKRTELLDGDEIRKTISSELGFTKHDRDIHLRRVTYICELLNRNSVIAIVALISPYRESRQYARDKISNFIEVWVNCPVDICMQRDPKGLYKKATIGKMHSLTGVQDPYEQPVDPEITVNTDKESVTESTKRILDYYCSRYDELIT